jgi:hypothetical protein
LGVIWFLRLKEVPMWLFFLIIVAFSVSTFCEPIADFAPDQIGNTWKYNVTNSYKSLGTYFDSSFVRTIILLKKEMAKDGTVYIFSCVDSGLSINLNSRPPYLYDSVTYIKQFTDTCFQYGDSIIQKANLLPFYKRHFINSDDPGISKIMVNNDSLYQFTTQFARYIQNIGLYSYSYIHPGGNTQTKDIITFISFTNLSEAIDQAQKNFHLALTTHQNVLSLNIYDLRGRCFNFRGVSAMPPGLMIRRGVNYLKVK